MPDVNKAPATNGIPAGPDEPVDEQETPRGRRFKWLFFVSTCVIAALLVTGEILEGLGHKGVLDRICGPVAAMLFGVTWAAAMVMFNFTYGYAELARRGHSRLSYRITISGLFLFGVGIFIAGLIFLLRQAWR